MKSPIITNAMLRGACREQRAIFRKEWPDGAAITVRNGLRAVKLGLDVTWPIGYLKGDLLAEYERQKASLWAEYERQKASLWAEYQRQKALLLVEYPRQEASLWAEYEQQEASLWAEYEQQEALLLAECQRQIVYILVPLLRKQLANRIGGKS